MVNFRRSSYKLQNKCEVANFAQHRKYLIYFIALSILLGTLVYCFRWDGSAGSDWKSIIDGDGKGYYAYYEQIFFSKNFGRAAPDYDHIVKIGDRSLIKYQCGTALVMAPFLLTAYLINDSTGDPYAAIYQKSVSVAAVFYLLLGLIFLFLLLKQLKIRPLYILLSLTLTLFATNLLVYVVAQPDMSHVYSFAMISGFLWASYCYIHNPKFTYLFLSAITLGIVYLIRPVNIIILFFIPFFFDNFGSFRFFIKQHTKQLILFALITTGVMVIQNILWYVQCGQFFVWPYQNEGFYWTRPEIFNVLFSFRKGLFVYTPLLLLMFLSLAVLFMQNRFRFFISLIFLSLLTYIIAAWWCWTYFDSYGMRPFIDFYGVFVILFALLLNHLQKSWRMVILCCCLPLLALNLVQSYQYHKKILSAEYMNYESYQHVFLKTSPAYIDCIGGSHDLIPYCNYAKQLIFSNTGAHQAGEQMFGPGIEFGNAVRITNNDELFRAKKMYAEISFKKWDEKLMGSSRALFVTAVSYPGRSNAFYKVFRLDYLPGVAASQWNAFSYTLILPKIEETTFEINMYIWNSASETFKIQDLEIKIYKTA